MTPVSPVLKLFPAELDRVWAKDQPEYLPLPSVVCDDGTVITRWRMTWRERWLAFWRGDLYLSQLTFNGPLQPQRPSIDAPVLGGHEA
jgi:hypothetical protein